MAEPQVLKAIGICVTALAELNSKEQFEALEAVRAALKAGQKPITAPVSKDSDWL